MLDTKRQGVPMGQRWMAALILTAMAGAGWGQAPATTTAEKPAGQAASTAGTLQAELDAIFSAPEWVSSLWGVKVVDLDTSEVLYEKNARTGVMPASNMKLVTTAAALTALGPGYRYETKIYTNGPVEDGVLKGDLVIVGSGDPSISGRYAQDRFDDASRKRRESGQVEPEKAISPILQDWAKAVKAAGIHRIDGAVIADDDVFDDRGRSSSWQLSYYQEYYAAESSGFAAKDNCWDVVIRPGEQVGAPARLEVPLGSRYVTFRNEVITTAPLYAAGNGTTTDTRAQGREYPDPSISISRTLDGNEVTLKGSIPLDQPAYKEWGSVHNGTLYGATLLTDELERQGIPVAGGARDADDLQDKAARVAREKLQPVHTHLSPPLSELVRIVNKPSQNFYADMLQRTVGVAVRGGNEGSFDKGERAVRDALTSVGVSAKELAELRMDDGSGLSRQDRVTPALMIELLAAMEQQPAPVVKAFRDSLPVMGVDGTLRTRLRGTPAEGKVQAKTGTIGGVRSLSGYLSTADNHRLAFCMIANNFMLPTRAATDAQDEALLVLLKARVGRDGVASRPGSAAGEADSSAGGDAATNN